MQKFFYYKLKFATKVALGFFSLIGREPLPYPCASAIITRKGKLLVVDVSYRAGYALPGGIIEKDESIEGGLKREIKEETGLVTTSLKYFGSYPHYDGYPRVIIVFTAQVKGTLRGSNEGQPSWVNIEEAAKKITYKASHQAVKDYLKKTSNPK